MTKSTQLTEPFDIYEVDFSVGGIPLMHLAGADMGGTNRIIPMPDGTEMPLMDARGTPIGRAKPKPSSDRLAMVMVSLYANSSYADTMMGLVIAGTPVTAAITATADAGTTLTNFSVGNVVFSFPPDDFDSGAQAMVFQGIGWDITVEA